MQVQVWRPELITLKPSATKRIVKCESEGLCLACLGPLGKEQPVRGLHVRCLRAHYRAVQRGDFTDEQRIADGKIKSQETRGRKPSNPVTLEARG